MTRRSCIRNGECAYADGFTILVESLYVVKVKIHCICYRCQYVLLFGCLAFENRVPVTYSEGPCEGRSRWPEASICSEDMCLTRSLKSNLLFASRLRKILEDLNNVNRKVKGKIHRRIISYSLVIKPSFVVGDLKIGRDNLLSFL
jgi:hypothetical protein